MRRSDAVVPAYIALQCTADEPTVAAVLVAAPFEQYGLIGAQLLSNVSYQFKRISRIVWGILNR